MSKHDTSAMASSSKKLWLCYIPALAWAILIYILLTLPEKDFEDSELNQIPHFDKVVHMGLFGAQVFWLTLPLAKRYKPNAAILRWITLAVILFGILMEYVQKYFTVDRSFDWTDMVADSVGAVLSYFCMHYIFSQYQKKHPINSTPLG
ncbi:MAG: VanZ family protein [Chitinophagaceae bacterium]